MTSTEYLDWFSKAFLHTQAALTNELASRHHLHITEEYVRSAFLRGLVLSRPDRAGTVVKEKTASWNSAVCWNNAGHPMGKGRSMQHDAFIEPSDGDSGAVCEVKWLKTVKADDVVADFWKLWLARGTNREGIACRTFLLVGGFADKFSRTMSAIRASGIDLRWSSAGAGDLWPADKMIDVQRLASRPVGNSALLEVLGRGKHVRTPVDVWGMARVTLRQRWLMRVPHIGESHKWRLALWEVNHRATDSSAAMNWTYVKSGVKFKC